MSTVLLKKVPPASVAPILKVITVFAASEPRNVTRGRSAGTVTRSL